MLDYHQKLSELLMIFTLVILKENPYRKEKEKNIFEVPWTECATHKSFSYNKRQSHL